MRLKLAVLWLALVAISCDQTRFYETNFPIENKTWNYQEKLKFEVAVQDTLSGFNFLVNLRHTEAYQYSNFYFLFHSVAPDGKVAKDTVHCILADENGKWLGSHAGDIVDNQILFKYNARFQKPGTYYFEIEQAMREENLPNILDAGLRIEYSKN